MSSSSNSGPADKALSVGRYYDLNTRRFLRHGHGGSRKAIRRAVWGPGVESRPDAIDFVNSLVAKEMEATGAQSVLDLGCGVGGSILYLAAQHPAHYLGVTVSRTQADLGSDFVREAGIRNARIIHADFSTSDFAQSIREPVDLAFAIESLLHVGGLAQVLSGIARLIRPGGILIVCDDYISAEASRRNLTPRQPRWLGEFRTGWHANGLTTHSEFCKAALSAGLNTVLEQDFTGHLELDRPRDLLARTLVAVTRWLPLRPAWIRNLVGGNALQMCLKTGIIRYMYTVFRKS